MARRKRPGDPLRQQVQAETRLRYGSSQADLSDARRQNYREYQNSVNTAEESANAIKQAATQSIGQLKRIYADADQTRSQAAQQIQQAVDVAKAPGSALAFAINAERAGATRGFGQERAAAQAEAVARGRDATAGLAYQKSNAVADFRANRRDIQAKQRDLGFQKSSFAQQRTGELQTQQDAQIQKERDRSISEQGYDPVTGTYTLTGRKNVADLTGIDPVTGKPLPGKGPGGRTKAEQRQVGKDTADATDEITKARTWYQRLSQGNNKPEKIIDLLKTGGSIPVPAPDSTRAKPKFTQMPIPAIGNDYLRAAVELETYGHLSQKSVHTLRTIRNVHIPRDWLPPSRAKQRNIDRGTHSLVGSVLQGAQQVGSALGSR